MPRSLKAEYSEQLCRLHSCFDDEDARSPAERLQGILTCQQVRHTCVHRCANITLVPAGTKAAIVADFAARLHIPMVRFISKGGAVGAAAPHPLYERPAALIFATEEDRHAFDVDQMAEAVHLVISPAK